MSAKSVYVFSANREGKHSDGTAKEAFVNHGATFGRAAGLQGKSFGIVTVELRKKFYPVGLTEIANGVRNLLQLARSKPEWTFEVTEIGAEHGHPQLIIAPLFISKPENVNLPQSFLDILNYQGEAIKKANKKAWENRQITARRKNKVEA